MLGKQKLGNHFRAAARGRWMDIEEYLNLSEINLGDAWPYFGVSAALSSLMRYEPRHHFAIYA